MYVFILIFLFTVIIIAIVEANMIRNFKQIIEIQQEHIHRLLETPKKEVYKEFFNGDKVIIVNNEKENIWTGVIVDEDYKIHDTLFPVIKDDKTGELIQSGGVMLKNDEEKIMLNALLKLDWNERWNLISKGRAGIYQKEHYDK